MANLTNTAKTAFVQGIEQYGGISIKDESIDPSRLMGQLDKIARLGKNQSQVKNAATALAQYASNVFMAQNEMGYNGDFIEKEKTNFLNSVSPELAQEIDLNEIVNSIEKKKAPPENLAQKDAATIDAQETQDTAETQAGRSAELGEEQLKELSNKVAGTLEPVMQAMDSASNEEKSGLMDQLLKTFGYFEDKAEPGKVDLKDLEKAKVELGKIMQDFDADKLKAFLEKMNPAARYELGAYMKNVLAPMLAGGHGLMVASAVEKNLQAPLKNSLNKFAAKLPSRPEVPTEAEVSLIGEKRNLVASSLALIARTAQAKLNQNPNYDVQAHFDKMIPKLQDAIQEQFGADTVLYKDDIKCISNHLENVKNVSQEKQKFDIQSLFDQYGKYAVMAAPMILGPAIGLLSKVPIVGTTIAKLAAPLLGNIEKFAPMAVGLFAANMGGSNKTAPVQKQEAQNDASVGVAA